MPQVSVVVPVYNGEKYVAACITSILSQTFSGLELLVVDDASTDQTPSLVQSFHDSRVRYVRVEHGGTIKARQAGIGLSQGEWLAFCDQDDVWCPHKLSQQMENIEGQDLIYSEAYILKNEKRVGLYSPWLKSKPNSGSSDILPYVFMKNPVVNSTVLLRRKWALSSYTLPIDFDVCMDMDYSLWLEMLIQGARFKYINEPLVEYRFHDSQQTASSLRSRRWREYVVRKFLGNHPAFEKEYPILVRNKMFQTYLGLTVSGWKARDLVLMSASFLKALRGAFFGTHL